MRPRSSAASLSLSLSLSVQEEPIWELSDNYLDTDIFNRFVNCGELTFVATRVERVDAEPELKLKDECQRGRALSGLACVLHINTTCSRIRRKRRFMNE